jgi:general secretion pathway protein G
MNGKRRRKGFTLIEILVVIAIIGIIGSVVTLKYLQHVKKARIETAKRQMREIHAALTTYNLNNKKFPETLEELVNPEDEGVEGLMPRLPKDPWGNEFEYSLTSDGEHKFELKCLGADGAEGGEDEDADIDFWEMYEGSEEDEE